MKAHACATCCMTPSLTIQPLGTQPWVSHCYDYHHAGTVLSSTEAPTCATFLVASSCSLNHPLLRPHPLPFSRSSYSSSSISHSSLANSGPVVVLGRRDCTAALDWSHSRSLFQKGAVASRRSSSCCKGWEGWITGCEPGDNTEYRHW